ncbi:hypothetical protein LCGC14_0877120 [marine sediment metagenome]|uniref:Uncharacterized protein n=1 Tax=marine sediment metagenome TaxID=412755 RepID=A0A0F9RMM8_9ZZZZ
MKLIIDGDYDKSLVELIGKQSLPISHIIVHVPQNPIGNGSIFLPKKTPSFEEFEDFSRVLLDNNIVPIAGIDSTCQGNFEAHMKQYKATSALLETLKELEYKNLLVSSPNNIGFVKEHFPSAKIYLSYSQYVTSLNRGRIFFEIGADNVILHPDIVRYFNVLKNFIKLKQDFEKTKEIESILPLNIGCNWGCIQWYQHHNMQSHRTIESPILSNQEVYSDIEDEFDYPLLYCWKERLEKPENLLKSGWISPSNIMMYENLGFETFILFTSGFSTEKILRIIKNYEKKQLTTNFDEILNIPEPYGNYWSSNEVRNSMIKLKPEIINDFCKDFPYQAHYPLESEMNSYCYDYIKKLQFGSSQERKNILDLINNKMRIMEKGAIKR